MKTVLRCANVLTIALMASACNPSGDGLMAKINQIEIGSNRAAAVAILGPPIAINFSNTLGVETTTLVWRVGMTTCEVTLVFDDRVIGKSCHSIPS